MTGLRRITLGERQLIEASAGTGKTHAITNLYVQLLLGINCAKRFEVNELLVLTFTRAATQELRYRVTRRIQEAQRAFQEDDAGDDELLKEMLAASADKARDRRLLRAAIQLMDEAAIFTIHGFCARVLNDRSFETGTLFDQQLDDSSNGEQERILKLACEDCFRNDFLSLDPLVREIALSIWATPAKLAAELSKWLYRGNLTLCPPYQPLAIDSAALAEQINQAKAGWLAHDLEAVIRGGDFIKNRKVMTRLEAMTAFCQSPNTGFDEEYWQLYSKASLEASMKKGGLLPQDPVLELIDEIQHAREQFPTIKTNLWHEMLSKVQARIRRSKEEADLSTVNDLLTDLELALSAEGSTLKDTLAAALPVAMVDEYQDTDDIQSRIFEHIYCQNDASEQGPTLLMIGDPKQAIYQFRGADVYTYINARQFSQSSEEQPPLTKNWRSTTEMIEANNYLFQLPDAFGSDSGISFTASEVGRPELTGLSIDGSPQTPYQLFCLGNLQAPLSADQARAAAMDYAAEETAKLLRGSEEGSVLVNGKRLKAGEIAFLIRSRQEAGFAQQALEKRGIHSVYLTNLSVMQQDTAKDLTLILRAVAEPNNYRAIRAALGTRLMQCRAAEIDQMNHDLVYEQKVAQEFWQYHDTWTKKNVGAMIYELIITRKLGERWLALPDGKRQLTDLRHLTEVLQGGVATSALSGCQQLLTWFVRQQQEAAESTGMDEHQLRLESDENLVKIVTMHAAKGLEYDLVLIPYPPIPKAPKKTLPALFHQEEETESGSRFQACVEFGDNQDARAQAEIEARDEDMRLCYVGMTRARYRCYLGMPTFKDSKTAKNFITSPMGQLMRLEAEHQKDRGIIELLHAHLPKALFEILPADKKPSTGTPISAVVAQEELLPALALPEDLAARDRWRMHSYSGIVHRYSRLIKSATPIPADDSATHRGGYLDDEPEEEPSARAFSESLQRFFVKSDKEPTQEPSSPSGGLRRPAPSFSSLLGNPEEQRQPPALSESLHKSHQREPTQEPSTGSAESPSRFTFPAGARVGVALHYLLEHVDFTDDSQHLNLCLQTLERIGIEEDRAVWLEQLQAWLRDILQTPLLAHAGLSLSALTASERLDELEFHFPVACQGDLKALLKSNQHPGTKPLPDRIHLEGMMTGFIDLVFRHEGKYYLADYKSNRLGDNFAAYKNPALVQAVMAARYDLQYLIYTLAVHRFLQFQLADYDYERDFGGVFYLFLRGMDGTGNASGVFYDKPELSLIQQLDGLMRGAA